MNKFSNFVVKGRYWFLGIFFVILVASAVLMNFVHVNYDLTSYLPNDSNTKQSIETMKEEFGATGTACLMVKGVSEDEAKTLADKIEALDGITTAVSSRYDSANECALINIFLKDGDYTQEAEQTITELKTTLDSEIGENGLYYLTGSAITAGASRNAISNEIPLIMIMAVIIVLVVLTLTTRSWIEPIILLLVIGTAILINMGTNYFLGEISFISNSISSVLLIALAMDYSIVLISRFREERDKTDDVYEAMKKTISGSIVTIISSGLTVMAGLISLVFMSYKIGLDMGLVLTKGVFISLLAVIFLMPALLLLFAKAIAKTEHKNFISGLKHIGTFAKKTRFVMPIIFVLLIGASFAIQNTMLDFNYSAKFSNENSQTYQDQKATEQVFGKQNALVLMFDKDLSIEQQNDLYEQIKNLSIGTGENEKTLINSASSFASSGKGEGEQRLTLGDNLSQQKLTQIFAGNLLQIKTALGEEPTLSAQEQQDMSELSSAVLASVQNSKAQPTGNAYAYEVLKVLHTQEIQQAITAKLADARKSTPMIAVIEDYYSQEQRAENIFNSENKTRFVFNVNADVESDEAIEFINKLETLLSEQKVNGTDTSIAYNIVSNTQNVIETADVFKTDRLVVELVSAIAILIIVLLAFRSVSIPVILILIIEGSIWINLAGNALLGNSIFFICYLLGTAIQMGATIDYGILLSDRYVEARRTQNKFDAIKTAVNKSFTTIITSGSILVLAAFSIGIFSSTPLISSIGYLIGCGALCASLCMLFVLPQTLLLLDKVVQKTTLKSNFLNDLPKKDLKETKVVEAEFNEVPKDEK